MATWRQALEVAMTDEEVARLVALSRSRTEPASRVVRAQMLLAYRENPSFLTWDNGWACIIRPFNAASFYPSYELAYQRFEGRRDEFVLPRFRDYSLPSRSLL